MSPARSRMGTRSRQPRQLSHKGREVITTSPTSSHPRHQATPREMSAARSRMGTRSPTAAPPASRRPRGDHPSRQHTQHAGHLATSSIKDGHQVTPATPRGCRVRVSISQDRPRGDHHQAPAPGAPGPPSRSSMGTRTNQPRPPRNQANRQHTPGAPGHQLDPRWGHQAHQPRPKAPR